jgi:hypothetical protein
VGGWVGGEVGGVGLGGDVDEGGSRAQAATDGDGQGPEDAHATARGRPPGDARRQPRVSPNSTGQQQKLEQCAPRHGEGGQRRRRTAAPLTPRGRQWAAPGSRPRRRPPRRHNPPRHAPRQQQQDGGKTDVLSCANGPSWALHRAMQQRCHHASASARIPSWPPMPRPRLQRAATSGQRRLRSPLRNRIVTY